MLAMTLKSTCKSVSISFYLFYLILSHSISFYLILSHSLSFYLILSHSISFSSSSASFNSLEKYLSDEIDGKLISTEHLDALALCMAHVLLFVLRFSFFFFLSFFFFFFYFFSFLWGYFFFFDRNFLWLLFCFLDFISF
jgi:hypothetical protein